MSPRPDTDGECLALRFALPPVLVWALSLLVFEALAFDLAAVSAQLTDTLATRNGSAAVPRAEEASLRILWAGSLFLFAFVAVAMLIYAMFLIRSRLSPGGVRVYTGAAIALCVAWLTHAALSGAARSDFSMIYFFTHDGLRACGCYDAAELAAIDTAITALNVLAASVPSIALIAGCSGLVMPRGQDAGALADIERRIAQLKAMVTGGSVLLVTGLVHQTLWQRWPAMLAGGDTGLLRFVESMSVYWGITYSLLIVAFYLPPAWVLGRRARAILEQDPTLAGESGIDAWLAKRGLSRAPAGHLPQIAAMLAPMLAGPLGATVAELGGRVAVG